MKVEYFTDEAGEYRWRLEAENHESVAVSGEGYTERNDAVEAFERVREAIETSEVEEPA